MNLVFAPCFWTLAIEPFSAMVPTQDRGRSPLRGNNVLDDDDWTVYSDAESVSSYSTVSDNYFSMQDRQDHAPVL